MDELFQGQMIAETQRLIDHALRGQHMLQSVESHAESRACRALIRATKKIAKGLRILAKEVYQEYLQLDFVERCQLELPIGINNLLVAADFYAEEVKLLKAALRRWRKYLFQTPIPELLERWFTPDDEE